MTTLAFDGKELAADQGIWAGDSTTQIFNKLFGPFTMRLSVLKHLGLQPGGGFIMAENRSWVLAQCNYVTDMIKIRKWLTKEIPDDVPAFSDAHLPKTGMDAEHVMGILLNTTTGEAYELYACMVVAAIESIPFAMGTGASAAMGAMMAGASATKAIKIACVITDHAKHGVKTYKLEQPPYKPYVSMRKLIR